MAPNKSPSKFKAFMNKYLGSGTANRSPGRMNTTIPRNDTTIPRSMSAGELEGLEYELIAPGPANGGALGPGEGLPAHPNDADMAALDFTDKEGKDGSTVRVLDPHSKAAKKTMKGGGDREVDPTMLHLTESWFYRHMKKDKAETILALLELVDGSFLVRGCDSRVVISLVHDQKGYHVPIKQYTDPTSKEIRFFIENAHGFSSVDKLVKYYSAHTGEILPVPLGSAVVIKAKAKVDRRRSEEGSRKDRVNMGETSSQGS